MTSHLTHYCIFFFSQNLIYNKEVQRLSHIQSSRAALYKTVQIKCSSSKYWTSAAFLLFTFKWSVKLFTVNRTIASNTWSCSLSLSSFIPVQIKFEFLLWKKHIKHCFLSLNCGKKKRKKRNNYSKAWIFPTLLIRLNLMPNLEGYFFPLPLFSTRERRPAECFCTCVTHPWGAAYCMVSFKHHKTSLSPVKVLFKSIM